MKQAPTAADLYGKGDAYWLDFPGDPLDAGCSYEQWFNRIAAGKATTAYAHIVGEQGKLALQYWFYYPFNEWNNKHESDWEMIQLVFDRPTAEEALSDAPELIGYSQHEGPRARPGTTRSSKSAAGTRSCTRARARTPTSSSRPCIWGTVRKRDLAVTTLAGRPATSRRRSC